MKQRPKSFTVDGKRYKLGSRIPTHEIRSIVATFHVGTSDEEIMADMETRAMRVKAKPAEILQCQMYALKCHRENQQLYRKVMSC